jgi:hypothetical protein
MGFATSEISWAFKLVNDLFYFFFFGLLPFGPSTDLTDDLSMT